MKTILVPTDFSANADQALAYAGRIARSSGAEIILLHVCDLFDTRLSRNKDLLAEHNRLVTADLNTKLERYRRTAAQEEINITTMLYSGQPVQTILAVSAEAEVDLVVMGTKGASGLKSVFFGTNTTRVLSRSPIPVLTIPAGYDGKEPRKILIAANEEKAGEHLDIVVDLATWFGSKICAVTISNESEKDLETVQKERVMDKLSGDLTSRDDATVKSIHLTGKNFYHVMDEFIAAENVDMLVMFTHERNIIENIFNSSMTRRMAYHTHIPLLSIRM